MTGPFRTGPDAPFISRRPPIPHDGSRTIIAVGHKGPREDTGVPDDDLAVLLAAALREAGEAGPVRDAGREAWRHYGSSEEGGHRDHH